MFELIYVSTAAKRMTKDNLQSILMESMRHNSDHNITGILLYDQGSFCQVLEGDKKEVLSIFKKIKKDKRHFNVITISEKDIQYREFSAWSMRFINLDFYDREMIHGYQTISENKMNWTEINASLAKNILMQFKSI
jgi:hypothetical protein